MDLSRFTDEDWDHVRTRLRKKEGNFDEKSFLAWLLKEETAAALEATYGAGWTLSQALTLATGKKTREPKRTGVASPIPPLVTIPKLSREEFERKVEVRVELYENAFDDIQPNDHALIHSLAMTEVSIEQLNMLLQDEYLAELTNADRVQKYMSALKGANETAVRFQQMLGIDRTTRDKQKEERTDVDEVMDMIEEAGAELAARSIVVLHSCGELIGRYVTAFKEFPVEIRVGQCPRCGVKDVVVRHVPGAEDLRAIEPEWVGEEEDKYRYALRAEDGE